MNISQRAFDFLICFAFAGGMLLGMICGCQPVPQAQAKEAKQPLVSGAIQFEIQKTEGPGFSAQILTWTEDSPTGRMLGKRNWYIGDKYLYAAVSIEELRSIRDELQPDAGWSWKTAIDKQIVTSCWYDRDIRPFYALRMDYFAKFEKRINDVHKGRLPWWVTRTEDDDHRVVDKR